MAGPWTTLTGTTLGQNNFSVFKIPLSFFFVTQTINYIVITKVSKGKPKFSLTKTQIQL